MNKTSARAKTDTLLKNFWRENDHFADLVNAVLFRGREVLKPSDLTEMDTEASDIVQYGKHGEYEETLQRSRDVVKKMAYGAEFAVFGIESQKKTHYAMPLRTMLYDSLGYLKEYREIAQTHRVEKGDMTESEFLSGMRKGDRLHPIFTIVMIPG